MATSKRMTKKDLESKITELESKIDILVAELGKNVPAKQDTDAPTITTTKPKGILPKGFDAEKPAAQKPTPKLTTTTSTKLDKIPEGTIPNDFAPHVKSKYFTQSGLVACMRFGALNGIKLPPEAEKMLDSWRPISK